MSEYRTIISYCSSTDITKAPLYLEIDIKTPSKVIRVYLSKH